MKREIKVLKFGGSSLANLEQITKAIDIVRSDSNRSIVVVSAPGKDKEIPYKVTDLLLRLRGEKNSDNQHLSVDDSEQLLIKRYSDICSSFGLLELGTQISNEIHSLRINPRSVAQTSSRGENYMARIMSTLLKIPFIDSKDFITPNLETSIRNLQGIQQRSFVFPGFYGSNNWDIFTFSRGGSDLTGSILANAFDASVYENWTDVNGIYYADPRILGFTPPTVSQITYKEIRELSLKGTEAFHHEAMLPLIKKNIQVNIRNTNNPNHPGTYISRTQNRNNGIPIAGVAGKPGYSVFSIEKFMMDEEIGFDRKVAQVFENYGLSIKHKETGEDCMSVVLENTAHFNKVRNSLKNELNLTLNPDNLIISGGFALVAVVGEDMVNTTGILGTAASALGRNNINIYLTNHAFAQYNITFGVRESDYENALRALYQEFVANSV